MSKNDKGGKSSVPKIVRDQNSQIPNRNKGTSGTNIHNSKAEGHRGMQIAQNHQKSGK